jgi:hypothetical protein
MIYDEYLTQAELQRWILEADVAWAGVDLSLARARPDLLEQVRQSALIESYFPVYTTRLMRAFWDQVDVTAVFSIQLYESYKHFYVLNRYLELVDAHPIADEELIDIRRRNVDTVIDDPIRELARYMISEHFAAYFFLRLARQAAEPVLAQIARYIAQDEFRHTQFAFDLLDVRLKQDASLRDRVLHAGLDFHHVGADVVARVPVSEKNDLAAILTLNKRLHRLCGVSLSAFAKGTVHASD